MDTWKEIIDVFAMRVSCLWNSLDTIEYNQYLDKITPLEIFNLEIREAERQRVFVLSAFPEFLIDYFGIKLWKTSVKHTKNRIEMLNCR